MSNLRRGKRFRKDLFFRLNVVTLELPPLRDRGDRMLLLAEHFLADFCRKAHRKQLKFSVAAHQRPANAHFNLATFSSCATSWNCWPISHPAAASGPKTSPSFSRPSEQSPAF